MSRVRLSEKEKVYWVCLLFPLFWPFLPALLLLDLIEGIRNGAQWLYRRMRRSQT